MGKSIADLGSLKFDTTNLYKEIVWDVHNYYEFMWQGCMDCGQLIVGGECKCDWDRNIKSERRAKKVENYKSVTLSCPLGLTTTDWSKDPCKSCSTCECIPF